MSWNDRRLLWGLALIGTLGLLIASAKLGGVNQDEGWYLYASRMVSEGHLPYRDFAYTQGPVMPFAYVPAMPLVARLGVLGGRCYTTMLAILALAGAAWLATRIVRRAWRSAAALMVVSLVGLNVYHATFTTVVKTYSLAALLIVLGLLALSESERRGGRAAWAGVSGLLLALATGTRSSAGFMIPAVFLVLVVSRTRERAGRYRLSEARGVPSPWSFAFGAAAGGLLVFGPFLLCAPRGLWFALVEYHAGREAGSLLASLAYKAGFATRLMQAYTGAALLLPAVVVGRFVLGLPSGNDDGDADAVKPVRSVLTPALWWGCAAVTAVHWAAPFPYDDYQVFVYPAFCVALVATLVEGGRRPLGANTRRWLLPLVVGGSAVLVAASPLYQDWFVGKRDRIWWPLRTESSLTRLHQVAKLLRENMDDSGVLLTQDTYLAVEAGRHVPAGMELGPFCYFPEWSREDAEACHVLNREMMLELLARAPAPWAAFSGYGLAIRSPGVRPLSEAEQRELWRAVEARYGVWRRVEDFGQAETTLRIMQRKTE